MRATIVSLVLLSAVAVVAAIFHHKPPRRQAHLAALEKTIDSALRPWPQNARFIFRTYGRAAIDYAVWCRYFAAPRRLLLTPAKKGDTVLFLRPRTPYSLASFSEKPVPLAVEFFIQP